MFPSPAERPPPPSRSFRPRRYEDALLHELAKNVRDVLWVASPGSRCLRYVSGAWETVWGRSRPPSSGEDPRWPAAVHPEDRARVEDALDRDALRGTYDETYRIIRPDDSERWIWDRAVVVRDDAGQVRYLAGIAADITERKQAEDDLRRSHARLRALSARHETVREEERTRVSREIHDQLGQALTGLKLDLSWLTDNLPTEPRILRTRLRALARRVESTLGDVRTIAAGLRPAPLDHLGLVTALEWQARQFEALAAIPVGLELTLRDEGLDPGVATAVFRIFQETLTNVARHARASRVEVRLAESDGSLHLEVRDDGRGITDEERTDPASLGLLGMEERARMLCGDLEVRRLQGSGTAVALRLPLRRSGEAR